MSACKHLAEDRSQANILQQRCMNMLLLAGTLLSGRPLTSKHIIARLIAEDRFFSGSWRWHVVLIKWSSENQKCETECPYTDKNLLTDLHSTCSFKNIATFRAAAIWGSHVQSYENLYMPWFCHQNRAKQFYHQGKLPLVSNGDTLKNTMVWLVLLPHDE